MIVFMDTEFTAFGDDRELISIGMVSEAGQQFYLEVDDFDRTKCTEFVRSAVLPLLGQVSDSVVTKVELGKRLRAWIAELALPLTIACDFQYDWDFFLSSLDYKLPANVTGRLDLAGAAQSAVFTLAAAGYHANSLARPWHHALHDAMALRAGWLEATFRDLLARTPQTDLRGRPQFVELEVLPSPYREEFIAWLAVNPKWEDESAGSAVRRSAWRKWLALRFAT
ncbi:3'-5' exoribonuclease Rv2179c-like domain-containing protein [Cupriavidus necator]|uniref:hypothetical protein n=1 Tax=Cupriavidus necator TaxID=106590 RepID=UPI003F73FF9A